METTDKPKAKRGKQGKPAAAAAANGHSTALVKAEPAKRGPRKVYGAEIEERILEGLRRGQALRAICKAKGMPDESTVRRWAGGDSPFAQDYRDARQMGYLKMADDIIELADDPSIDAHHKRIMVDTRKWALSKALPKIFGDRIEVDNKGGVVVVQLDAKDMLL